VITPWHTRAALAADHLQGVVVRIAFDADATGTTVTRTPLKLLELLSSHEGMMKPSRRFFLRLRQRLRRDGRVLGVSKRRGLKK
jgi:hypothetical protein